MICNDFRKLYNHLSSTLVFETDTLLALLTICEFSHSEHKSITVLFEGSELDGSQTYTQRPPILPKITVLAAKTRMY